MKRKITNTIITIVVTILVFAIYSTIVRYQIEQSFAEIASNQVSDNFDYTAMKANRLIEPVYYVIYFLIMIITTVILYNIWKDDIKKII